jgi:hypothetical protein
MTVISHADTRDLAFSFSSGNRPPFLSLPFFFFSSKQPWMGAPPPATRVSAGFPLAVVRGLTVGCAAAAPHGQMRCHLHGLL